MKRKRMRRTHGSSKTVLVFGLFCATLLGSSYGFAQDGNVGEAPKPGEGTPQPLPIKADLTPRIPAEFNRPVPDYHIVRSGDTLFDISRAYFGSPYLWPIVWSFNAHITNPHWIYPGDIVYLRAPLPGDAPFNDNDPTPLVASNRGISIAVGGFITGRAVSSLGQIEYSPEGKDMLTFPDRVYFSLNSGENARVRKGKVYAILRPQGFIRDEEADRDIGTRFHIVGAVRVVEVSEDAERLHTAVIVQAWEEIYRNDLLFPYERQLLRVAASPATKTVVGSIMDTLQRTFLFGEHNYVFIDKGEKQGVRTGNRFFAYHQEDGRSTYDNDEKSVLPFERMAQILIIQTEDNYSTGLITESRREVERGWRVEMYEGF